MDFNYAVWANDLPIRAAREYAPPQSRTFKSAARNWDDPTAAVCRIADVKRCVNLSPYLESKNQFWRGINGCFH